jgi:DNA transformation protein
MEKIQNIGPKSQEWLNQLGIFTLQDLHNYGAVQAYMSICSFMGKKISIVLLYALQGAVDGRHWASYTQKEKQMMKAQVGR